MVIDLPSGFVLEDKTSPAIKQHKTANTLILLKRCDCQEFLAPFMMNPTPSKFTLCKLKVAAV